ncbi:serine/threonine-protein phosphatase 6 regulatory ankyrin repeat subunit B isoform X3 [Magallana gigas]|uniref:serine/threonine-protein phosphatase 6 regulatory ankyrin repeat subunit B isoform X3 n=1 Tax=Magallana gigas TaxID=29159 RepID=UPI0033411D33
MKLQTQFCLLRWLIFLFYCSSCEPRKLEGYEFPVFSTESCPRNHAEWNERSSIINCTQSNGYTCLPNENFTELLEFCYVYPRILITKGICLYLYKRYSRVNSYNCSHFRYGCPDSNYFTSEVYNYPTCISIKDGCFLAEPSCESTTITYPKETYREWSDSSTIIYKETTKHIHVQNELSNDRFIEILVGAVINILVVSFSIILYICRRRGNFSKGKNETDIENNDELNSLIETPKLCKVDTTKKVLRFENAVLDQWREDDTFFISTRACEKVESKLENQNLVVVTGHSGSGKSAIIQHIALKYKDQGWIVKSFKDVREMIKYILEPECYLNSTILVLNDPIGKDTFDKSSYLFWEEPEQAISTFLKKGKMLISCRNYILFDDKVKGVLQENANIVDIEDGRYKLTNEEKRSIWNKYMSNDKISEEDFTEILNTEMYFPLLCKLFSSDIKYQSDGYRFFKEPVKVVEEQIRCYRKEDRGKYCALVLLVLFNNNFCCDDAVRNKRSCYKFKRALTICGLPHDTSPYDIGDNLDLLKGFFVKKIGDAYEFYHDFVMEMTSFIFRKDHPAELIQYADIRFLLRRVTLDNGIEQNRPFTIYLSDIRNIDILGERFFKALFEECYIEVILHPALRDKRLIEVLQKKFERHPKKLQELLQTKKSMYDDHKQYWPITDDTMLKLAFVALENEFSPLCALVAFCHSELSFYCLKNLYQSKTDSIGKYLISAVCCNGSKGFLEMFSDESIKDSLKETFGGLFPIHITALFYNFDILQELIHLGADVNMETKDEKSWTPLMIAASRYDTDPQNNKYNMDTSIRRDQTVQILIDYAADVNLCAGDGVSSLFLACQNGHTSMVEILLSNGAYINHCTRNGESPVLKACQERHNDIVQLILEKGGDINSRTAEDEVSPLYIACQNGHDSTVQTLVDHGADLNLRTSSGGSPLFIACQKGYNNAVQILISKGAAVNMCKKNGDSPLYIACKNDNISTVKLLLSNGANVNLCKRDKTSPLFIACQNGNESLLQLLLDNGADINICDEHGASPLLIACQKGYNKIVQLLLTNGANIYLCTLGFSPLIIACKNGHEEIVRTLLEHGADVNLYTSSGASPLFIACQIGFNSSVQLLIEKGAVVNMCKKNGDSPLYVACKNDHISTVKLLLSNKADVNLGRKDKTSPLFIACQNGNENLVQLLLVNGADMNIFDEDGFSPLLIACQKGYNKIVQLLLTNGVNIDLCTLEGFSPLVLACEYGHEETVRTLLEHGADVNLCTSSGASPLFIASLKGFNSSVQLLLDKGAAVNICKKNGASPLYVACQNDHISTVELLLNNEADVNLCREDKTSPLFIACQNGNKNLLQLLLDNGADINICDEDGASPLLIACQNGHEENVRTLLKHGAAVNLCTSSGASPLFIACQKGYNSSVQLLIDKGAVVNVCMFNGASPLYVACENGHISTVKLLLSNKADANLGRKDKTSPLFKACQNGNENLVQLLLDNGADINICDKGGASPLLIACQKGYNKIVQRLLSNGADINLCTLEGFSPLVLACQNGHEETVRTLLENGANINIRTIKGTAEDIALQYGHEIIVQVLKGTILQKK